MFAAFEASPELFEELDRNPLTKNPFFPKIMGSGFNGLGNEDLEQCKAMFALPLMERY